jgi:hypothetical protein
LRGEGGFDSRRRAALFDGALVLCFEGALVEGSVCLGVAEGTLTVVVVVVVEFLVDAEAAELVEDGVEAGLEAVLEVEESGEGGRLVLREVHCVDGGGGVGFVVEPGVGRDVSGVGLRRVRAVVGERGV